MGSDPALQWSLTGVFAVCAATYAVRARAAEAWRPRVAWSLHVLMALGMIVMAWPWGMNAPVIGYVVVFTASALYFAYLGLFGVGVGVGVGHTFYHAAMMASMVLMALAMSSAATPLTAEGDAMGAMPGMAMAAGGGSGAESTLAPAWVMVTCGVAATFFVGAALRSFYVLIRGPQRPYANLLMTAGMGVSFAVLAI